MDTTLTTTTANRHYTYDSIMAVARKQLTSAEFRQLVRELSEMDDPEQPGGSQLLQASTEEVAVYVAKRIRHMQAWRKGGR